MQRISYPGGDRVEKSDGRQGGKSEVVMAACRGKGGDGVIRTRGLGPSDGSCNHSTAV